MQKSPLIGVSIITVVLLVLGSLTNAVGYKTVQSSNQKVINNNVDQKELLFQSIVDIANNKEIQRVLLTSQIKQGGFFEPGIRFSVATLPPVLTKKFLDTAYNVGVILSKAFSPSKIYSILKRFQVSNQDIQKDITAIIKENNTLNNELNQLVGVHCDCEKNNTIGWNFPVVCILIWPIGAFLWTLSLMIQLVLHVSPPIISFLLEIWFNIGTALNCFYM